MIRSLPLAAALLVLAGPASARSPDPGRAATSPKPRPAPKQAAPEAADDSPAPLKVRRPVRWTGKVAARCESYRELITEVARDEGIDVALVFAIVRVESGFNARATSSAGARGLMQVMRSTGRRLGCGDTFDPETNLRCGLKLLKGFLKHYDDHLIYGLSAYAMGFKRPSAAREASTLPPMAYFEKIMNARATFLRHGCGS